MDVSEDPRAVVPERCLVFELIGDSPQFNLAAQALGLEWLATESVPDKEDEDEGAEVSSDDPASQPPQRLYLTMPTEQALKQLLAQWKKFKKGDAPDDDQKALWKLFEYLHALRVWSIEDRLDPAIAQYVASVLEDKKAQGVIVEIDLWYRTEAERRDQSLTTLRNLLKEVDGELLDEIDLEEIRYQGALVRLPGPIATQMAGGNGKIAALNDVMTIRPQSAYESQIEPTATESKSAAPERKIDRQCIAALLDGYPIDKHEVLDGRLEIIEVDIQGTNAPAATRNHGTAMASLIVHGDLQTTSSKALSRPLAVLPVLVAPAPQQRESTPAGKLPIGVIYRALKFIVEAAGKNETSPLDRIVVINHSICDQFAPFVRRPTPWAILLDYFSHTHRLLFVVSAGNILTSFPVSEYPDLESFSGEPDPLRRQAAILASIEMAKGTRGLLSPAESINSLTVGAVHGDDAPPDATGTAPIDPYPTFAMSNLASALGLGVNRSVKPDLLERGGRFTAGAANKPGGAVHIHPRAAAQYGQEVAAPSNKGDLKHRNRTAGTSNAAALVTRAAHFVADAVEDIFEADGIDWQSLPTRAVMLKTLLAHSASWGQIGEVLDKAYPPRERVKWSPRRNTITRFLGYGQIDHQRIMSGNENRITLLGEDMIRSGDRHEYIVPVPAALLNNRDIRSCTVTLSWTCPTTHTTVDPRGVVLQLSGDNNTKSFWPGVKRSGSDKERVQPNMSTAARGTLVHVVHDGKKLMADANGKIVIGVQAMAKPGFETHDVPYAVAITLEIGQQQRTTLYAQVSQQVQQQVEAIRTRTRIQN